MNCSIDLKNLQSHCRQPQISKVFFFIKKTLFSFEVQNNFGNKICTILTFHFYQLVILSSSSCLSSFKFGIKIYLGTTRCLLEELTVTFNTFLQLDFLVWRPCHTYLQNSKPINHKLDTL